MFSEHNLLFKLSQDIKNGTLLLLFREHSKSVWGVNGHNIIGVSSSSFFRDIFYCQFYGEGILILFNFIVTRPDSSTYLRLQ